jgi:hypothetical protein
VETVIEVGSKSGGARSAVRITTHVQSLISCEHSEAWIENDLTTVPVSTAIRVLFDAYDVDGLPINHTRAAVEFRFGMALLAQQWSSGKNRYVAEVSADSTTLAGRFELVVTALNGSVGPCELLRRPIEVTSDKTQQILAGGLAGVMVLSMGMLGYLLYRKKENTKELVLSFLSFEGLLMLELCFEVWVTPRLCYRRRVALICPSNTQRKFCFTPCYRILRATPSFFER